MVGISYNQAKLYSEWRTNRVVEFWLIQNDKIKVNKEPTINNHFTIDKYIDDKYEFASDTVKLSYFPIYKIPYEHEWKNYIYSGIQKRIINAGSVQEIAIVKDNLLDAQENHVITEVALDSIGAIINSSVGNGNNFTGFRNICTWQHFKE